MNKLFLTSGLVLCLACPAMAATDITSDGHAWGSTTTMANCTETYLGSYTGPVNYEAKWAANISGNVTLDSKRYETSSASSGTTATTNAALSPVYVKYETGVYPTAEDALAETNAITSLSTNPAQRGYSFAGFYTGKAGTGTPVISSAGVYLPAALTQITTAGAPATWYAHYTANSYNVVYNPCTTHANGTGLTTYTHTNGATYDESYTPKTYAQTGLKAIDAGWHFKEWKGDKQPDGTAATEQLGFYSNVAFTYQIPGTLTLTGICEQNQTIVNYSCGSTPSGASTTMTNSTTAPTSATATFGNSFTFATLESNQCNLPGYTATWACTGESGTTGLAASYGQGEVVNPWAYTGEHKHVITCTANWTARPYKITYKPGTAGSRTVQGDNIMRAVNFDGTTYTDTTGGALKTLASNTYSITGYDFKEWSSDHNISTGAATTTFYNANTSISPYHVQDSTVMTAKWTAHTYSDAVTYSCGNGEQKSGVTSGDMVSAFTYDASYSLKSVSNLCKKDGYHVKTTGTNNISGWVCKLNSGTGYLAAASGTWTYTNSYTCEAQWEANVIDLTWYRNHSAGDTTTQTGNNSGNCTYDGGINLPTQPSRTGYTFNGWTIRSAGNSGN